MVVFTSGGSQLRCLSPTVSSVAYLYLLHATCYMAREDPQLPELQEIRTGCLTACKAFIGIVLRGKLKANAPSARISVLNPDEY